jgi:hypothetical protein
VIEGDVEIAYLFLYEITSRIQINFEIKGIEKLVDSLISCVPGHELPQRTAVRRHAGRK